MNSLEKLVLGTLLLIPIGFAGGIGYALTHIQPPRVTIKTPGPVVNQSIIVNQYAGWAGIPGIILIAPGVKVNCIAVDPSKRTVTPNPIQQCLTEMIAATRSHTHR